MILRIILVLNVVLGCQISRAQIIEEMTVEEFGTYIYKLIEKEKAIEAYDLFNTYANFIPTYNKRISHQKELLDIQKRIEESLNYISEIPKERLFEHYLSIIFKALEESNYQKALIITSQFKDDVKKALTLYNNIINMLPSDSIQIYYKTMPYQLFSVPQMNNYYDPNSILDNTLFYLKKDSSLFSGVIISRDNGPQSMETEIAGLNYDRFENGKRVERKFQGYVFSNSYHKNKLFFGHDSSHYRLNHTVVYDESDTIQSFFFGYKEELIKEQQSLNLKHGGSPMIKEVEYNLDGTIKKWKELAPVSEKHSQYSYYSCWVNQFGDTISEEFTLLKGEFEIIQERTLNESGDTINLSRTVNSFLDGLQIENRRSSHELNFELRYVFDNGKLIDILSDSVLYFNEDWKIISEEEYIHLMNQDNDYSYFYSGIFKEYFPDVEFKTHPYFLSVSDVVNKNYKKFKKEVRKYFKVKI